MKQTTMQFEKKQPVTIQRLQSVVNAVAQGSKLNKALKDAKLKGAMGMHLVDARILIRLDGKNVIVHKPILERKDFYRVMDLCSKHEKNLRERRKLISFYEQKKDSPFIDRPDTDMLGLVKLPKIKPVKKAVALPWWKRFLLYLLNH
jgi:hypothetical protein